ncbi:MAG: radical SAM protein [Deltaproteobacteria bacterium]|nr:radical SAM protein [Deltaproteobacteria bacterium]
MNAFRERGDTILDTSPAGVFRRYTPKAGHPDWPTLFDTARESAREVRKAQEPARRGWRETLRRARSVETAARAFAVNAARAQAGREDLLPLYFIWTTHRACNFLCSYCDDHRGRRYPELPLDGALDTKDGVRLLRVMRTRAASVYFSGGEPTLRKDLPLLVRAARDLDYYPIIINTNAATLDAVLLRDAWRTFLADIDQIVVSLDALDLATLRDMWRWKRPERVVKNLLMLRELATDFRFKLAVNCVIQPGATAEARDVLDLAADLGIWFSPVPMNIAERAAPQSDEPAYRALAALILKRKAEGQRINGSLRMNRRLLFREPLDCRNTLKPHVDHDGRLFWPCKSSVNVEPLLVNVLDFEHVDALWAHCRALIDPTNFHGPGPNQCGGACNWAQNYTTDAYAEGLHRPLTLAGEVREFLRTS